MLWRVEVGLKKDVRDVVGEGVARTIRRELDMEVDPVGVVKVFTLAGLDRTEVERVLAECALHDPVLHDASLDPLEGEFDWTLEVGLRPGVTDNEGRTAQEAVRLILDREGDESVQVYTSTRYLLNTALGEDGVARIAKGLLANELIQRFEYKSRAEWVASPGFEAKAARVTGQALDTVETVDIAAMGDAELMGFSRANTLALSLVEMHRIRDYYAREDVVADRLAHGLTALPTDAEIEVLAQTWSEHCKHKIFNARIDYRDEDTGETEVVDSLFNTCIAASTKAVREAKGDKDFCLSVFKDNAGVIRFDDDHSVCIKVETHNSPSALDPYGGALTGIVGVNRDPMGTGMGANLVCNTDVFCFASPFWKGELPPRLLHPSRVLEGVREGVEHGGNKSGIPTVNGSIVFEDRYLGKPLVYCGTIGMMPTVVPSSSGPRPSHDKKAMPGDFIVMAGGRIGKDGIHGATFSSEELHEGSPATAVQIGDPITQRKMYDFLMRARDLGLYNAITDNGAGGLSSSVGETAEQSGGCDMDLARAPLKYDGLKPWEILVSEAQERMSLAVPPETIDRFLELAREMDVETTPLGTFTDSGYFHIRHGEKTVARLGMDFLHEGVPQMELSAVWKTPEIKEDPLPEVGDHGALLERMLARLNICSKEYVVRQYDHEVQGGSAVKPMVGIKRDGPSDAGVLRPKLSSMRGLVVAHGICPKYSDLDAYWMMANAIDEAVRNAVAVGGDVDCMAGVDNFCWCDPVQSESTPDGQYKLAQLVRANKALDRFCRAYGVPCVSGKDSMKNDYKGGGVKISIPPTVLYTVMGVVPDVSRCLTSDFKRQGDLVYLLGATAAELGGSEAAQELGFSSSSVPRVDPDANLARYRAMYRAAQKGLATACHDLSDGGLAVALAEMCIGGRIGARVDLGPVGAPDSLDPLSVLYAESAGRLLVSVRPENRTAFEDLMGSDALFLGEVGGERLEVSMKEKMLLSKDAESLARAFKSTLDW